MKRFIQIVLAALVAACGGGGITGGFDAGHQKSDPVITPGDNVVNPIADKEKKDGGGGNAAPMISNVRFLPDPIPQGGQTALLIDYQDTDADLEGGFATILFENNITSAIDITIAPLASGTLNLPVQVSPLLQQGPHSTTVYVEDKSGNESNRVNVQFTIASDPCYQERQREPSDNEAANAIGIEISSPITGCIADSQDVDFFMVQTPPQPASGGILFVSLSSVGQGLQARFEVWDKDGNQLWGQTGASQGAQVKAWVAVLPAEFFYIRLSAISHSGAGEMPYSLECSFRPVNDPNEPDNSKEEAKDLQLDQSFSNSFLFYPEQRIEFLDDYFKVTLSQDGNLEIKLSSLPSDVTGKVVVYDFRGVNVVGSKTNITPGESLEFTISNLTRNPYYIKVTTDDWLPASGEGSETPPHTTQTYSIRAKMR